MCVGGGGGVPGVLFNDILKSNKFGGLKPVLIECGFSFTEKVSG